MADIKPKKRIGKNDWEQAARFINSELELRRGRRAAQEAQWKEIDRQIAMIPDETRFFNENGKRLDNTEWRTAIEVPFQAQTLELLTSDARRLMFPTDRNYFSAHANVSDELLETAANENLSQRIQGDNDPPERVNQGNIDAFVEGVHHHYEDKYDFRGVWDLINADALKYGMGMARIRMTKRETYDNTFRGVVVEKDDFPQLTQVSIKAVYPDDNPQNFEFSKSVIWVYQQRLIDLIQASGGSKDPTDPNGGWIPKNLNGIDTDKIQFVDVVEYEGDMIIERASGPLFFPNVIVTAVSFGTDNPSTIIRWRENQLPFQSWIPVPYMFDDVGVATSPLMKGLPLQKAMSVLFSNMIDQAILDTQPPVSYDEDDPEFAATGGPVIAPGEQWKTSTGDVKPHQIGNAVALLASYQELVRQYQEVTGSFSTRLGAQTKSHQTAFAVDTEVASGLNRTVDYVRSVNYGAMRTWLSMEWEMILDDFKDQVIYVQKYQAWLAITKDILPEQVTYDVEGSGGPSEERAREQKRAIALQGFLQIEAMKAQLGQPPSDLDAMQKQILREGFPDADIFDSDEAVSGPTQAGPPVQGAAGGIRAA